MAAATSICRELRLRDYRNFTELELQFPAAGAAIIGENGAGKTNLLEALYYLEIFRSFRGAPDEQLVRFDAPAFHLRGRFEDTGSGRTVEVTAAYEVKGRRKRVTVNGVETERSARRSVTSARSSSRRRTFRSLPVCRASDVATSTSSSHCMSPATSRRCSASGRLFASATRCCARVRTAPCSRPDGASSHPRRA